MRLSGGVQVFYMHHLLTCLDPFSYLQNVSQENKSHHHNNSTTNHWTTGCLMLGWVTSVGHMDDPIEKPQSATFHS